jgi:hypothetical protein
MENLKLLRKVKKKTLRNIEREKIDQQVAAAKFAESLIEIDNGSKTNEG